MAFTKKDIKKMPKWAQDQIKEAVGEDNTKNLVERNTHSKKKCSRWETLDVEGEVKTGLVDITGEVTVRITRVSPRRLDDDNLSGGAKQLRDAIASLLGRKGDSEEDGFRWEYYQEKGEAETIIEILKED